ncbi:MAG: hypothetical protein AAFO75_01645 [Pseudomonadota bacterium]
MATKPSRRKLIQAIDHALAGQWAEAHQIVQAYDADVTACHIHAVLHRLQGDKENAMYWYRQAGEMTWPNSDPQGQLLHLRQTLDHQY